jgi:hypothetical protein
MCLERRRPVASSIEKYLREQVEANGGTCEKFVSPGKRFVPDDIVTWPMAPIEFVEVKEPGDRLSSGQIRDHIRRRAMGQKVTVVKSNEDVDRYVRRGNP